MNYDDYVGELDKCDGFCIFQGMIYYQLLDNGVIYFYVVDNGNNCIKIFCVNISIGQFILDDMLGCFCDDGGSVDYFKCLCGVCIDLDGNFYVVDIYNGCII